MAEINQRILDKINHSSEKKWVKDLTRSILNYERSHVTTTGRTGYKSHYEEVALDNFEEDGNENK